MLSIVASKMSGKTESRLRVSKEHSELLNYLAGHKVSSDRQLILGHPSTREVKRRPTVPHHSTTSFLAPVFASSIFTKVRP